MTEWLHFHFSLSRTGEGNGGPLQCSCLENPRDDGAWWASIYGVAQSRTRLKRLSSSRGSWKCFFFGQNKKEVKKKRKKKQGKKISGSFIDSIAIYLVRNAMLKITSWDFPGGPVVKNPPVNEGNTGLIPGPGKIPRASGQLSLCELLNLCSRAPKDCNYWTVGLRTHALQEEKPPQREAWAPRLKACM